MTTAVTNTKQANQMPGSTTATGASANSKSATSKASLATNFNTFLTMLTTQLKHQDPLSPMDSTQFTNQLVQFASVEQQINANSNLETLINVQKINQTSQAIGYLGQVIEAPSSGGLPLQDGKASFSYFLNDEAKSNTILVKDSDGKTVASIKGETGKGRHEASWDGKDALGKQLPDGTYAIEVVAADAQGSPIANSSTVYGRVTDVGSDSTNGTVLSMGGAVTALDKVLTIRDPASLAKAN